MQVLTERTKFASALEEVERELKIDTTRFHASIGHTAIEANSLPELRSQLVSAIYAFFHLRNPEIGNISHRQEQDLRDSLILGIPHLTHQQIVQSILPSNEKQQRTVNIGGVKVRIPDNHLIQEDQNKIFAKLPSWRDNTTPGYVLAISEDPLQAKDGIARVYIGRESSKDTFDVWSPVLKAFNQTGISYHFKALSATDAYPRSDALVLYTARKDLPTAIAVLRGIPELSQETGIKHSLFTEMVGPNLTVAEEPIDFRPSYRSLSFGQHRSRVLVDALLVAKTTGSSLEQSWVDETLKAGINADFPAYNRV